MELLIIGIIFIILIVVSLITYFSNLIYLQLGIALASVGLLLGVPAGCYYHFLLFKTKNSVNLKIKRWWVTPHQYHKYFPEEERKVLKKWFFVGALFFNIIIAGCILIFIYLISKRV